MMRRKMPINLLKALGGIEEFTQTPLGIGIGIKNTSTCHIEVDI